ncbi:MAG: hypothetical protein JWO06_3345, partial [Bacteroidota bacterium]|nr:hypothetical protein [Bacteroidota bacterium]
EACLRFSAKTKMIYYKAVLQQKKVFEAIYAFMNQKRIEVEATPLPAAKKTIFQSCNKKISQLTLHANQFQKDRMCYPVNNAYFLRIAPYALHYFEIQNSMNGGIDMDKGTAKMLAIAGIALQPQLTIPKDNLHWSWSAADTLK